MQQKADEKNNKDQEEYFAKLKKVADHVSEADFETVESLSQSCAQRLIFNVLDKKETIQSQRQQFETCQKLIDEYRERMIKRLEQSGFQNANEKLASSQLK